MKHYRTFPHSREALETLWSDRADLRAAFDEEDRQEGAELARAREERFAENNAYELARVVILRAQWAE